MSEESQRNAEVKPFHRLTAWCAVYDIDPRSVAAAELPSKVWIGDWIRTGAGAHHFATEARIAQALANIQELGDQMAIERERGPHYFDSIPEFERLPPSADGGT